MTAIATRLVDPDLLDRWVIEVLLRRPEPGDVREHGPGRRLRILNGRHDALKSALLPRGERLIDRCAHALAITQRVDAT
ncbi:hypothetical protein [Demequina aestuarii]|uniref:hypothetical protein n=1 Tax=Demequina aestuarii TaxID=327095 RepID=UPI0007807008|nr:hypothetical protein [Demequina aestuarii]